MRLRAWALGTRAARSGVPGGVDTVSQVWHRRLATNRHKGPLPMKPVTVSVTIDRPRREVYEHLDALANHEAFTDHFLVDRQLSGPPRGVGATLHGNVRAMGRQEPFELTVIDAQAPSTIVEVTKAAGGRR